MWAGAVSLMRLTRRNRQGFRVCPAKRTADPGEYAAARSSTLAHYTSPTVIKAIYEAVGRMGLRPGNILEPSWVWAISSVCCRRKCETAVCMAWA